MLGLAPFVRLTMAAAPYGNGAFLFHAQQVHGALRDPASASVPSHHRKLRDDDRILMRVLFPTARLHRSSQFRHGAQRSFGRSPVPCLSSRMISAIMSASNAILLVVSAGISHDLYGKLLNPAASDRSQLRLNRISIFLLGLVPIWFALQRFADVQELVVIQTRFVASFFFVPMVFGLNSRFGTSRRSHRLHDRRQCGCWPGPPGDRHRSRFRCRRDRHHRQRDSLYFAVSAATQPTIPRKAVT